MSSPEEPSCFGSVSDMEASPPGGGSMERSFPVAEPPETGEVLGAAVDPAAMPLMQQREGRGGVLLEGLQDANNALRQELLEAKEKMLVLKEEVASAMLAAREQASKRMASEVRVKSLEVREGMESLNRKRENGDDTLAALFLREPVTLFRFRKYFHIVCIIFSLTSQADALAKENHAWFGREWFLTACRRLCFADG